VLLIRLGEWVPCPVFAIYASRLAVIASLFSIRLYALTSTSTHVGFVCASPIPSTLVQQELFLPVSSTMYDFCITPIYAVRVSPPCAPVAGPSS
jgi:hypothetical protein